MSARETLIHMLRQLLKEVEIVTSQGAGYYTCVPFARRYNRLLAASRKLFEGDEEGLIIGTFDELAETDPKDPSEKSTYMVHVRVEVSQLIALLESTDKDRPA